MRSLQPVEAFSNIELRSAIILRSVYFTWKMKIASLRKERLLAMTILAFVIPGDKEYGNEKDALSYGG